MTDAKSNKFMQHINYIVRVTLQDTRIFIGTFKAFDKHMNLILADCEEFRELKRVRRDAPSVQRRVLGFILLRGHNVVSITVEGPPPGEDIPRVPISCKAGQGSGLKHVAGRGMPPVMPLVAMMSDLQGPLKGIGGPLAASMVPKMDNNKASLMGLLPQMMPPLPPTISDGQPKMPSMGQDGSPKIPGMGRSGQPPLPKTSQMGPPPLPETSRIRLRPLAEISRIHQPSLPETSQMGPPPVPPSTTLPTNNKRCPL